MHLEIETITTAIKGGPAQESTTSGTLIAFSSFQGFSSVELGRSIYLIELDRFFRDPIRRRLSMQVLLDYVSRFCPMLLRTLRPLNESSRKNFR